MKNLGQRTIRCPGRSEELGEEGRRGRRMWEWGGCVGGWVGGGVGGAERERDKTQLFLALFSASSNSFSLISSRKKKARVFQILCEKLYFYSED